jgi:hypothetical protein
MAKERANSLPRCSLRLFGGYPEQTNEQSPVQGFVRLFGGVPKHGEGQ